MTRVIVYESHPAVLAGLRRRLEAEPELEVIGAYGDLFSFQASLTAHLPDIAVISGFGGGAIQAANLAHRTGTSTRLVALVPGTRRHERMGYPPSVEFVSDGPRGDLLVKRVHRLGATTAPGPVVTSVSDFRPY